VLLPDTCARLRWTTLHRPRNGDASRWVRKQLKTWRPISPCHRVFVYSDYMILPLQDFENVSDTVECLCPARTNSHSPITLANLSSINLVSIFRCSSPPCNPVYTRCVDPSTLPLVFHHTGHSYISLIFISRSIDSQ